MSDSAHPHIRLGIIGVIGDSLGLFFRRFPLFFLIAAVPSLAMNLLSTFGLQSMLRAQASGEFLSAGQIFTPMYFVVVALAMLIGFLVIGVTTMAAYDSALNTPIRIGAYVGRCLQALLPIVFCAVVFYIMLTVGLVLLVLPGIYLAARYFVFTPAILIEGAGFSGLSRAAQLSRGYRWPIVGGLLLVGVVTFGLSLVGQLFSGLILSGSIGLIGYALLETVLSSVVYAFIAVFTALLYARLREIKEGLGIRDLAEVFA